ncbi:MAG: xylan 1,4-beta-xylosidase [Firmicutes bacterium]|nr:xylan 1,4-beta-xylosidase [Bacillota bacterium]
MQIKIAVSTEIIKKYNKNFKKCIGSGRLSLALRQDYMENLAKVQREIGFEYIRGHGIFHDDTGVYREEIKVGATPVVTLERPLFNFKNILKIIDNLLSVGIKPFVEFGFMPEQMAAGDKTIFWWKGNVTEPKNISLWVKLIKNFLQTAADYYGIDEVKKWYFEVWNEPCVDFWQPVSGNREEEYHKLYKATAEAVKSICPDLKVGGPATQGQGVDWVSRFIEFCASQNIRPDFISHHVYTGYDRRFEGEFCYMEHVPPSDAVEKFKQISDIAEKNEFPLHITEWNTSYSCIDPIHDTAFNAAYVAYILTHADDLANSYSYWVFSDVFEEADIPRALFHGGFGLLTENGIRKPVFHAFAFANRLKENILRLDDICCVTIDNFGNISMLLFNPVAGQGKDINAKIEIPCKFDEVIVSVQKVDEKNGNAYEVWKTLGRPRYPKRDVMEIVKRAQYPSVDVYRLKSDEGKAKVFTTLPANGIQLIEVTKLTDYTDDYQGLKPVNA